MGQARELAITALWHLSGSELPTTHTTFSNVPTNAAYATALDWAVQYKVVDFGSMFLPNEPVSRANLSTALYGLAIAEIAWQSIYSKPSSSPLSQRW